jgi:hypothetical protein
MHKKLQLKSCKAKLKISKSQKKKAEAAKDKG